MAGKSPSQPSKTPSSGPERVPVDRLDLEALYEAIQNQGLAAPGDLAEELGWPRSSLTKGLKKLQQAGRIEKQGGTRSLRYRVLAPAPGSPPAEVPGAHSKGLFRILHRGLDALEKDYEESQKPKAPQTPETLEHKDSAATQILRVLIFAGIFYWCWHHFGCTLADLNVNAPAAVSPTQTQTPSN